jgi:hypothetical protein
VTVPRKPDFRLSVVDHTGAKVYVLIHGVSLPLYPPFEDLLPDRCTDTQLFQPHPA